MIDTDMDGVVDAIDASYAAAVPQDTSVDKTAFHTSWISGFSRNAQGNIALKTGNEIPVFIEDNGIIPPFIASSDIASSEFLRLGNGLIVGQKCVFVFGAPNVEFAVKRRDSEGNLEDISKTWTMPEQGWAVVQLTKALQLDDKVVVVPSMNESAGKSYEWHVTSQNPAILFEIPLERAADQGTQFRLRGDGFLPSHRVHYKSALGSGMLPTTFRGRTKLDVDLPIVGTSAASPPYSKSLLTRIWIEDVSGGVALTEPRLLFIRHD